MRSSVLIRDPADAPRAFGELGAFLANLYASTDAAAARTLVR